VAEVVQRLAHENEKLARRPRTNGEYFVVCTLYYTPKESALRSNADSTQLRLQNVVARAKIPRDFLRSVKRRLRPDRYTGQRANYVRYNGGDSYAFVRTLRARRCFGPRFSGAMKSAQGVLRHGAIVETESPDVQKVFRSNR